MEVQERPIGSIQPYENNPRVNDAGIDAVAASIREYGFRQPIVVDERDVIIVGHTRYKAARKLGLATVPVHVARGLTESQARAYRIADNQTANLSAWDDERLPLELSALQDVGFDLSLTGFSGEELQELLAPAATGGLCDPDDVPEAPREPITRPGDLWLLGRHRLLCGDATKAEDVARVLDGPADILLTDPPYNVAYTGKTANALTLGNDAMDEGEYRRFLGSALGHAIAHVRPGGAFYIWHADLHGLTVRSACADAGLQVRQCLVWAKNTMVLGRQDYQWKHEPCLYGWADGAAHSWYGDRTQTTVLEFDKPARNGEHPTMKPVELFAYLLRNSCPKGGRVFDPFGGSGTTLIAAEQEGCSACILELDPRYVDVITARYEAFSGTKARRADDPRTNIAAEP
ncbi:MAG: DNA modification methylase [Gemmataceae bacterium]